MWYFFFQAEDGIRDLVRSRGLGDVYKRQLHKGAPEASLLEPQKQKAGRNNNGHITMRHKGGGCLLYTSDAADERSSVDLGGRRIIKKKNIDTMYAGRSVLHTNTSTRKLEK